MCRYVNLTYEVKRVLDIHVHVHAELERWIKTEAHNESYSFEDFWTFCLMFNEILLTFRSKLF